MKLVQNYLFIVVSLACLLLFSCDMGTIQPVTVGGSSMNKKLEDEHIEDENLNTKKELIDEQIAVPKENVPALSDEFSSSIWEMQSEISNTRYQIRFSEKDAICRIYGLYSTDTGHTWWGYANMAAIRSMEKPEIMFDFQDCINYAKAFSLKDCQIVSYAMFKSYYEISKHIAETTKNPEFEKKERNKMVGWLEAMEACSTYKSFLKVKNVDEHFKTYKKYFTEKALGLQAITPVKAELSEDKQTLTVNKMLIGWDNKTDKPIYAENIVFTRKK